MNEALKCSVCRELFNEPKQLKCGHTYCNRCVNNLDKVSQQHHSDEEANEYAFMLQLPRSSTQNRTSVHCPQCRCLCPIPQNGLSTNYALKEMVEKFREAELSNAASDEDECSIMELTPIPFKAQRVYRRIIRSPATQQSMKLEESNTAEGAMPSLPRKDIKTEDKSSKKRWTHDEISKRRWTQDEICKLKLALKVAVNPEKIEHWELICRAIGGDRTVEECRDQANKLRLLSAEIQPDKFNCTTNKFFKEHVNDLSIGDLNLDDSLLTAAFNTPPDQAKCARRPFLVRAVNDVGDNGGENSSDDD